MPTISLCRDLLFSKIGKSMTDEEFDVLCFEFGIELDEITSEYQIKMNEQGSKAASGASKDIIYKIDVPANRYDLLCMEGIARALRIFIGLENPPSFTKVHPPRGMRNLISVKSSTKQIRPFVVSAILRNVSLNKERYESFIDLQDKLHQNICRRRTYVAIGTHDLDTIEGPFSYEALAPKDIEFVPLSQSKKFNGKELLDHYRTDPDCKHLKPYTDIIYDSNVYPVIYDKNRVVLSLPPIINSEHSKISLDTKNIFIECTATDLTKGKIVLNTMIAMFSEYCQDPFTVEPVDVVYEEDGRKEEYPDLSNREVYASVKDIQSMIFGADEPIDLSTDRMCKLCDKMQLAAEYSKKANSIKVQVPPTRADILHAVDVIEDIAIAYGYNNIPNTIPKTQTVGMAQPLNKLGDWLRSEISRAGYIELLTHGLCSTDENFKFLNHKNDEKTAVVLSNPASVEFEVVRTTMIPGLLKTVQNNKSASMKNGLKLFEISDVVVQDPCTDIGARNVRRLSAIYTGYTDGFEIIHGLVDRVFELLGMSCEFGASPENTAFYRIIPSEDPMYFSGRCAKVVMTKADGTDVELGMYGVLHPTVLENYDLSYPCSVVEMDIEPLL